MGERIRIATAQNSCCTVPAFFPFVEGICSQISEADAEIFKAVNFKNDGFVMRVAQAGDASGLYNVLRSYGTSQENYDDLEMFAEDKMDICVKNISCCLQHRFFVTFLNFIISRRRCKLQGTTCRLPTSKISAKTDS